MHGYDDRAGRKPIDAAEQQARARRKQEEAAREAEKTERMRKRAAEDAEAMFKAAQGNELVHPYLARKQIKNAGPVRVGVYRRWHEDGELEIPGALLIPLRNPDKSISSMQAIFPDAANPLGRDRDYLPGGKKQGCYFNIGTPAKDDPTQAVYITEGYATGCSVHDATGAVVMVAFDAGNLEEVAKIARQKLPQAQIVIAADNDRWNADGKNPGLHFAKKAAAAVGGRVAVPVFPPAHDELQPTDFNDLAVLEGLAAVKGQLDKPAPAANDNKPPASAMTAEAVERAGFTILGYDRDVIFIFPHEAKQIKALSKGDLTENGLLSIAPVQYWEEHFPKPKARFDKTDAVDWLFRTAYDRGVFDPDRIRGRGAWLDRERIVFHLGDRLHVDGDYMPITRMQSRFIYQAERPFPRFDDVPALTSEEGEDLLRLAGMFRWSVPASAALLAGWCMLAPVCGALQRRRLGQVHGDQPLCPGPGRHAVRVRPGQQHGSRPAPDAARRCPAGPGG